MDITLRQLQYFAVLGVELNYRRAAEKLYISQPALSTAIKQLERHIGTPLFVRNTREVLLTEIGAAWLPQVQGALESVEGTVTSVRTMVGASHGKLRLGFLIGTGADVLFRMIRQFEAAYPGISVEATEFDFSDPTAGLDSSASDVAIIRPPVELPDHRMIILSEERWMACLPTDHALASRPQVALAELLEEPIVCAPESAGMWRDYWMAMDARDGRPPVIAGVASTYEAETTLISRGLGISFTSDATARLYERPGVVYVPITDQRSNYTALAWSPERLVPQAEALVRFVHEEWAGDQGRGQELAPDMRGVVGAPGAG